MTNKTIYIEKYDWFVSFYALEKCEDIPLLLSSINDEKTRLKISNKVYRCGLNTGLTYSKGRKTIMIIGRSTCAKEFLNTLTHEIFHLAIHIGKYYDLDLASEEPAYIVGDFIPKIFNNINHLICSCHDRRRAHKIVY